MKSRLFNAFSACAIALISQSAQAVPVNGQGTWETTLQGRDLDGNAATYEAYYDTALDITWLADTTAAGYRGWADANTWAAGLDVNGVTGWRLPTLSPVNGTSFNQTQSADGTTDRGYAATTTDGTDGGWRDGSGTAVSEMGHMYYVTLGNLGACDPTLPYCTGQSGSGLSNTGPFSNLQEDNSYWYDTEFDFFSTWGFLFNGGEQTLIPTFTSLSVWAVRSGDVSAVPVPAAVWLFGSGLIGLLGLARRKH